MVRLLGWSLAVRRVRRRAICAGRSPARPAGTSTRRSIRRWRTSFWPTLREKFGYPDDHVKVLSEEGEGSAKATRENVRAAFADLRKRVVDGDVTLVLLVGHGTADSDDAKFNLVGPDLTVDEWAALVKPLPGRVVFVNASSGSFPFLAEARWQGPGRADRERLCRAAVRDGLSAASSSRPSTTTKPTATRTARCRCWKRSPTPARR